MTRTKIIIGAFVLLAWGTATGEVNRSKHDIIYYLGHEFNEQGGGAEACTFCHHLSNGELSTQQEWDSSTWGESAKKGFTVYSSKDGDDMLICQSCHDGVVVADIFGDKAGGENHPVGFNYVELSYKKRKFPYYDYRLGGVKGASGEVYPLKNYKMECITCHDPHMGEASFVRGGKKSLRQSSMCVDCHSCIEDQCG